MTVYFSLDASGQKYYPAYNEVISSDFPTTKNIFPIATIDAQKLPIKIHIAFVYFNYDAEDSEFLVKGDNTANYSFQLLENGLLKPLFTEKALEIEEDDKEYLNQSIEAFQYAKKNIKLDYHIDYPKKPEWWQSDETPKNAKGKKFTFICQIDCNDILKNDCRMYIFYDEESKTIKNICQWT
jgi:hypothetical protein